MDTPNEPRLKRDFFISYAQSDRNWAEWIAWQLEVSGYTIEPLVSSAGLGSDVQGMVDAAVGAQRIIAVISPDYLASRFVRAEWAVALARDPTGELGVLLPIRVRESDLKGLLSQVVYVDLVGTNEAEATAILLRALERGRAKPTHQPIFPDLGTGATDHPRFPGGLPPVWNVPHTRNPYFVGREDLLANLHRAFSSTEHRAAVQAITGIGGMGKTQLAIEFAYRYVGDYDCVWWIRSEEAAVLATDYATLAARADLWVQDTLDQQSVTRAVRDWLERTSRWLLVFDDAREPTEIVDYLPRHRTGDVIITSRNPRWHSIAAVREIENLNRTESIKFLQIRIGDADLKGARDLAEGLKDLPFALEQAAAYVASTGQPVSDYLARFQNLQQEFLEGSRTFAPQHVLASTVGYSFADVESNSPAAADLLRLVAFVASDPIPSSLIGAGVEYLSSVLGDAVKDTLKLTSAIDSLRRYSLVEGTSEALSVHQLVQEYVRDHMSESERRIWTEIAIRVIDRAFPEESSDIRVGDEIARLLPHVLVVTGHGEREGVGLETTARLLSRVGQYFVEHARLDEAGSTFQRALRIAETVYGTEHPVVATAAFNLGNVLRARGDLMGAHAHYERALKLDETAYGADHLEVAADVNSLGGVLQDMGDLVGALENYTRALRIYEAAYGQDHPSVAIRMTNLGGVLRDLGDLEKARTYYEQALRIYEAVYGTDHPSVAASSNDLGNVLQRMGIFSAARAYHERAMRIYESVYGPGHVSVAASANNLGTALQGMGSLVEARAYYERALRILEASYGIGNPHPSASRLRDHLSRMSAQEDDR